MSIVTFTGWMMPVNRKLDQWGPYRLPQFAFQPVFLLDSYFFPILYFNHPRQKGNSFQIDGGLVLFKFWFLSKSKEETRQ